MTFPRISPTAVFGAVVAALTFPAVAFALPQEIHMLPQSTALPQSTVPLVSAVPEPATWALMFLGMAAVGGAVRYARRRAAIAPPEARARS